VEPEESAVFNGRQELKTLLEFIDSGNVLMVTGIDRLALSFGQNRPSRGRAAIHRGGRSDRGRSFRRRWLPTSRRTGTSTAPECWSG
jgi:hypothetical protein